MTDRATARAVACVLHHDRQWCHAHESTLVPICRVSLDALQARVSALEGALVEIRDGSGDQWAEGVARAALAPRDGGT